MKILHQVWHNPVWNIDAYYNYAIGDGFIFCARNHKYEAIFSQSIWWHLPREFLELSFLDLEFYGWKESIWSKLETYPFHAMNLGNDTETKISLYDAMIHAKNYQESKGLTKIIIPNILITESNIKNVCSSYIHPISKHLIKAVDKKYYMTITLSYDILAKKELVNFLLSELTSPDIKFDWYYIVVDSNIEYKQKVSTNMNYFESMYRIFSSLKKNWFEVVHWLANWDSLIFLAIVPGIDYISIGTYENLRKFNISKYTRDEGGWASKGWYFSEKLLNMVKPEFIDMIRNQWGLELIQNDLNIFSDEILTEGYVWSSAKPSIHKNYLLALSRLYKELDMIEDINDRIRFLLGKIEFASNVYADLQKSHKVKLIDESSNYHLWLWESFLLTKLT